MKSEAYLAGPSFPDPKKNYLPVIDTNLLGLFSRTHLLKALISAAFCAGIPASTCC